MLSGTESVRLVQAHIGGCRRSPGSGLSERSRMIRVSPLQLSSARFYREIRWYRGQFRPDSIGSQGVFS